MAWTRRQTLQALGGLVTLGGLGPVALAAAPTDKRLLVVLLRGGLDGLAAVPPHADPELDRARPRLGGGRPGGEGSVLDLDGTFGLHPALAPLVPLYAAGQLLPVQAVGTSYRGRSHFAAQDVLEAGSARARTGWLNRTLGALGAGEGVVVAQAVPLALTGPAPVVTVAPQGPPAAASTTLDRVAMLYEAEPELAALLARGRSDQAMTAGVADADRRRRSLAWQGLAALMAASDGPRIGLLALDGWDTHQRQASRLTSLLEDLGRGLASLPAALGAAWADTVVVVVSEFGRTVAENGTAGTDHGTGGVALLAGGAVAGGRVLSDWPGLGRSARLDGRDLRPTTDLCAVWKGVLGDHLGLDRRILDQDVFPESPRVVPLAGLVRTG